jgi:hypothetical protein
MLFVIHVSDVRLFPSADGSISGVLPQRTSYPSYAENRCAYIIGQYFIILFASPDNLLEHFLHIVTPLSLYLPTISPRLSHAV